MIITVLGVFLLLILLLAFYGIAIYNKLVRLRNMVREGFSSIDVMLKKRHDLIPNLVETVKGYATHERATLDSVTQARAKAMGANTMQEKEAAETELSNAMMRLNAVAEQYPNLKADANFRELQGELSNLEGDIEKARRYYNGTVRDYNITVESFPSSIVANMGNFQKEQFFELENTAERATPKVQF
ncbi:LemA protein [Cruoricaptor ignavus]|uniref:LemA protein n=1 Tax=Cruoricaptor ignavus TaxID=1118202 RepID=A0A1M6A330_9FLAO|nr:LemA family protein [Cruoricaptor ignavus]SHI30882.1 LemA protein [Cruoricaptor ignavus]